MYLINGQLHDDLTLDAALHALHEQLPRLLDNRLASDAVLDCAQRFAVRLLDGTVDLPLADDQRHPLAQFCQRTQLSARLERELGLQAQSLRRIDYRQPRFEGWHPLGLVVHVMPGNAPTLPFCAALESLLAGNINWLRPSRHDKGLTARLLAAS